MSVRSAVRVATHTHSHIHNVKTITPVADAGCLLIIISSSNNADPLLFCLTEKAEDDLPLDKFLCKVTSEDNASFSDIMKESEEKHRLKHAWLYEQEEMRTKVNICFPCIEVSSLYQVNI